MSENFDPYYKWLGIPPKNQPPTHYRLLGIELFESDREVIDSAANRLMAYLKTLSTGEDATHAQRLLNEAAGARRCLLDPQLKADYDAQLSAPKTSPTSAATPSPPPALPTAKSLSLGPAEGPRKSRRRPPPLYKAAWPVRPPPGARQKANDALKIGSGPPAGTSRPFGSPRSGHAP